MTSPRANLKPGEDPRQALLWKIRVKTEESAFVYAVFEAQEGWLAYSTPAFSDSAAYRDLELQVPVGYREDVRELLRRLGDLIYVLDAPDVLETPQLP